MSLEAVAVVATALLEGEIVDPTRFASGELAYGAVGDKVPVGGECKLIRKLVNICGYVFEALLGETPVVVTSGVSSYFFDKELVTEVI